MYVAIRVGASAAAGSIVLCLHGTRLSLLEFTHPLIRPFEFENFEISRLIQARLTKKEGKVGHGESETRAETRDAGTAGRWY